MSLDGVDLNFWGTAPSTLNVHAPTTTQPYSFSSSLPDPSLPVDDEPLYVNAKQYYRILKRRVARARLEEVHRLSRQRKVRFSLCTSSRPHTRVASRISMNHAINMQCVALEAQAVAF